MKKKLFLASMLTVLMCACSQSDELVGDATTLTSDEIGFANTFVNNGTRVAGEMTNQTIKTDGNNFGVWGKKTANGTATDIFTNQEVKYTAADNKWDYTPHRYWDAQAAYTFNATMPMDATNASCTDGKVTWSNIPLSAPVSTGTDYLVAKQVTSAAAAKRDQVKFTFQHILSKLNVFATASYGAGDDVTVDLNSLKLSLPNGTAKYEEKEAAGPNKDEDTWTWSPDGTTPATQYVVQADGDLRMNNSDIYKKLTNSYFVAPTVKDETTDLKMDIKFTVTYNASKTDGTKATEVFEYKDVKVQDLHTFTQGYITNLYVKINLNAIDFGVEKVISFATATVEDWTDSDDNYIDELGYSFNFTDVASNVASAGVSSDTEVATIDTYGNKVVGTTTTALTYNTDGKVYSNADCTTEVAGATSSVADLKVKVNNIPANTTNEVKTYYVKVTTNQDDSRVLAFKQEAAIPIFTVLEGSYATPMGASYTFAGTDLVMTVAQLDDTNTARVIVIDTTTDEEVQLTTNDTAAKGTQTYNNATGAYSSILSGVHNGKTVTFTPTAGHTYSVEIHCEQDPLLYTKYTVKK